MGIIIDTQTFTSVFDKNNAMFDVIQCSIGFKSGIVVPRRQWIIGGSKCRAEINRVGEAKKALEILAFVGAVKQVCDKSVDQRETTWVAKKSSLQSKNDEWCLALAEVSGCRLLVSDDKGLRIDFRRELTPGGRSISSTLVTKKRNVVIGLLK